MTINKFNLNIILVNINKLKPYRFMEDQTLQLVLIKPSSFLPEEPMEVTHFDNLSGSCKLNSPFFWCRKGSFYGLPLSLL
jgi:hypothetical protein